MSTFDSQSATQEHQPDYSLEQTSNWRIMNIFKRDDTFYEGVPRINIYVLRLYFALMAVFVGTEAWSVILTHNGVWEPIKGVAWCVWAAYSTLAVLGIFHTLRMLPIMLFMVFYKGLWLLVVAYPLWITGTLKGSPAEEMTHVFSGIVIPIIFIPWRYVLIKFILPGK
jgi:hypothetical protein